LGSISGPSAFELSSHGSRSSRNSRVRFRSGRCPVAASRSIGPTLWMALCHFAFGNDLSAISPDADHGEARDQRNASAADQCLEAGAEFASDRTLVGAPAAVHAHQVLAAGRPHDGCRGIALRQPGEVEDDVRGRMPGAPPQSLTYIAALYIEVLVYVGS